MLKEQTKAKRMASFKHNKSFLEELSVFPVDRSKGPAHKSAAIEEEEA